MSIPWDGHERVGLGLGWPHTGLGILVSVWNGIQLFGCKRVGHEKGLHLWLSPCVRVCVHACVLACVPMRSHSCW